MTITRSQMTKTTERKMAKKKIKTGPNKADVAGKKGENKKALNKGKVKKLVKNLKKGEFAKAGKQYMKGDVPFTLMSAYKKNKKKK